MSPKIKTILNNDGTTDIAVLIFTPINGVIVYHKGKPTRPNGIIIETTYDELVAFTCGDVAYRAKFAYWIQSLNNSILKPHNIKIHLKE